MFNAFVLFVMYPVYNIYVPCKSVLFKVKKMELEYIQCTIWSLTYLILIYISLLSLAISKRNHWLVTEKFPAKMYHIFLGHFKHFVELAPFIHLSDVHVHNVVILRNILLYSKLAMCPVLFIHVCYLLVLP